MVLYALDGIDVSLSFKVKFPYSNNEVEYKALFIELIVALQIRIRRLVARGDPKLIIEQFNWKIHA